MRGRPSKIKPRAAAYLAQLRQGRSQAEAARRVGINEATARKARQRHPAFGEAVKAALAEGREAQARIAAARRALFLVWRARCPSVAEACRRAGLSSPRAYKARRSDADFAGAWDAAAAQFVAARRAAFLGCLRAGEPLSAAYRKSGLCESAAQRAKRREPAFARAWQAAVAAADEAREQRWERQLAERGRMAADSESALDRVNGYPARLLVGLLTRHRPAQFKERPSREDMIREGARLLNERLNAADGSTDDER